jgi:hypothetical protein
MSNFGQAGRAAQQGGQLAQGAAQRANRNHESSNRGGGSVIGRFFGFIVMLAVLAAVAAVFAAVLKRAEPELYSQIADWLHGLG